MDNQSELSQLERYRRLAEISRDLASTVDLNVLLNRITRAAADLSSAEAASILLFDEGKKQLYFETATNLSEPLMRGLIVPIEGSIAGWIVTNHQSIIINDTQNDPRHFPMIGKITNVKTTSLLGVPLIAKDKVVGALEAINKNAGDFVEEDQEILLDLGAQAAVAIENARLFQQSDLIAEMVHELRTPLASIRTASHLLKRKEVSAEKKITVTEIIDQESTRLIEMTSAFLDIARLESGRMQFRAENFDPQELISDCANLVRSRIEEKGLEMVLSTPSTFPPYRGDRDKIKQVILNLLTNAINYNRPAGKVTLKGLSANNELVISVADTGLGIPPEDLEHLFDKFYRSQKTEQTSQGTGLGLAICKKIVEAHNGFIEVQSQVNVGTQFTVHLPTYIS